MTHSKLQTIALGSALAISALVPILAGSPADAKGKHRGVYIQEYTFNQPMDGLEGHEGGGFCSFQRIPNRKCNAIGQCKIVSWTLRQICQ